MTNNKYGNLLDKYIGAGNNKTEEQQRYGDLLKNAKPDETLYNDIVNVSNANLKLRQQRAEEDQLANLRMKERIERKERELEARRAKNDATINSMLDRKKAEQDSIIRKKKEEAERAEIYKRIEKLMETAPDAAQAYIDVYANKLKII